MAQATLRIVKVFWCLTADLAYKRHFPAISWLQSYSLYNDQIGEWLRDRVDPDWTKEVTEAMLLLQKEAELEEIVRLVGYDSLSAPDRLTLEAARSIREDYLQQNGFDEVDTYTSLPKQVAMLKLVLKYYNDASAALQRGAKVGDLFALPVRDRIARMKYVPEDEVMAGIAEMEKALADQIAAAVAKGAED